MQILDWVSGLDNFREFSQPLKCLDEAMHFSKLRANLKRHNHVYILLSKHTYRPMNARVVSQLFYKSRGYLSRNAYNSKSRNRTEIANCAETTKLTSCQLFAKLFTYLQCTPITEAVKKFLFGLQVLFTLISLFVLNTCKAACQRNFFVF